VRYEPAPCPPPSIQPQALRVVAVAIAPQEADEALLVALRDAAGNAIAADPGCRIACITVVPPTATLSGVGEEDSATGRHIRRLIELRAWAKPLELPEERGTYHVLESDKPGHSRPPVNDIAHLLISARGAFRRFGVSRRKSSGARLAVSQWSAREG
jgi:hypothetical protein